MNKDTLIGIAIGILVSVCVIVSATASIIGIQSRSDIKNIAIVVNNHDTRLKNIEAVI